MKTLNSQEHEIDSVRTTRAAQIVRLKTAPVVIALWPSTQDNREGRTLVKVWIGKRAAAVAFHSFKTRVAAVTWAEQTAKQYVSYYTSKAAEKAARGEKQKSLKASDHYKVGDVLYTSWGYDQTNVDFYQVVRLTPKGIVVRPVKSALTDSGAMSGYVSAIPGAFCGKEQAAKLSAEGYAKLDGYGLHRWNGQPKYRSWYA